MAKQNQALFVGERIADAEKYFGNLEIHRASSSDELYSILQSGSEIHFDIVVAVDGFSNIPGNDLARILLTAFRAKPLFFITYTAETFNRPNLLKNGYTDAFLLPLEKDYLIRSVMRDI